jgi:prevent-host-death family protein
MKATAKDLRFHSKELLESVNRGEEVVITYRGKPWAKLIPFRKRQKKSLEEVNNLFGIWKDNDAVENVDKYVRNLRKGRS